MKKALLILGIIFIFSAITVLSILNDVKKAENETTPDIPDISETFPTNDVTVSIPDTPTVALKSDFGPAVQVNNFLKKPDIIPDMQNQGVFFLGNTFSQSETEVSSEYVITYTQETSFFNVTLLKEPLNRARLDAETYLRGELETTDSELCALSYTVSTPDYVNKDFAGKDLRFSFCPGNTALPLE
ncbi:MAG: hypothetical protein KBC62_03025 [Candidatus Pacebacteria bacterium]|nr:hypothetical protein [Candidatus Paceibacterota bacterium]MBP9842952.1 hypothetical protein [Candidatus Paceibacterota bacterium]